MKLIDGTDGEIIHGGLSVADSYVFYIGLHEGDDRPQLYRTHLHTRLTDKLYRGKKNERVRSFTRSPDGKYIALFIDKDGSEKDCLHILDVQNATIVFRSSQHLYFDFMGIWVGKKYYFSRIHDDHEEYEWMVFSCETFTVSCLKRLQNQVVPYVAFDGQLHVGLKKTLLDVEYVIYDMERNCFTPFSGEAERIYQMFIWKNKLHVVTDRGEDFAGLYRVTNDRFKKVALPIKGNVNRVIPYQDSFVVQTNEKAGHSLYLCTDKAKVIQLSIPEGVIHHLQIIHQDLVFLLDEPSCWGSIRSFGMEHGELRAILEFDMPMAAVSPTDYSYSSFDHTTIHYMHYEAEGDKAIIYIHGGPEFQAMKQYYPLLQRLRRAGYHVYVPNIRGSDGYGRSFVEMDDGQKRLDAQYDIVSLVDVIIKRHGMNAENISIIGESYGGYTTLSMITRYPNLFRCAVAVAGMSSLNIFFKNTAAWRIPLRQKEYGNVQEMADFFETIAPLTHANSRKTPLLLAHGRKDIRVGIDETFAFLKASSGQASIQLEVYDDEGHEFNRRQNIEDFYTKVMDFFKQYT